MPWLFPSKTPLDRLSFPDTRRPSRRWSRRREPGKNGRAVILPISVPCHCRLLQKAAGRFADALGNIEFRDCAVPVIPNCDPSLLHSRERTKDLLVRQIISPVRWRETIERMAAMGVDTVVEIGPKRILSGLIRRIDRRLRLLNVEDEASLERTASALNSGTGE